MRDPATYRTNRKAKARVLGILWSDIACKFIPVLNNTTKERKVQRYKDI